MPVHPMRMQPPTLSSKPIILKSLIAAPRTPPLFQTEAYVFQVDLARCRGGHGKHENKEIWAMQMGVNTS
jgi:hypothetical protein